MACDYIINAGAHITSLSPIVCFETLGSAIRYADDVLKSGALVVEVVYMPEDDEDINIVLYRAEQNHRPRTFVSLFINIEEIIKLKIQKEVSE